MSNNATSALEMSIHIRTWSRAAVGSSRKAALWPCLAIDFIALAALGVLRLNFLREAAFSSIRVEYPWPFAQDVALKVKGRKL